MNKESATGQKVRIQNRYAVAEYESLDDCAKSLSMVGVMDEDEIRKKLEKRERYINGYVITYL